ncbi:FliM/FliN family flagellar motor switch protein [Pseudoalteromonas distincta]|uniref:FliM/FliN family flagellar motor switch protein n=1 Tax=Pseudoalteromonas distincta TaxID=77608 RepID=UPI0032E180CB
MNENLDSALAGLDLDGIDDLEGKSAAKGNAENMSFFQDVPLLVTLEVASTEITLGELSQAKDGDVLRLDKVAGEPLDVKVNGVYFAKAEVVMAEGQYGLKFIKEDASEQEDAS